jgi:hypothetical protein
MAAAQSMAGNIIKIIFFIVEVFVFKWLIGTRFRGVFIDN